MTRSEFQEKPPVLVDIGASGEIHPEWRLLAPFATCIAFDADDRDFDAAERKDRGFARLFLINRIVAAKSVKNADFFLTTSPYCSSALKPDARALEPWAFRDLFKLQEVVRADAIALGETLEKCSVEYIDWFKTDSQGTDLRLFQSLPDEIHESVICAEFEPGIVDAYIGEDKLHQVMSYMDKLPFWVTSMRVKGSQRLYREDEGFLSSFQREHVRFFIKRAPGWCEICYLNTLQLSPSSRDILLGWIIATIKSQHGFALYLAREGSHRFGDPIFEKMSHHSKRAINSPLGYVRLLYAGLAAKFRKVVLR